LKLVNKYRLQHDETQKLKLDAKVAKKLHKLLNTSGYRFLKSDVTEITECKKDVTVTDWCLPEVAAEDSALNKCKAIRFKPRTEDVKKQYDEGIQHYSFTDKGYSVAAAGDAKTTETN
jgi:hypothetical protein